MMPGLYVIPLTGLKEGRRTYNFEIGNEFFDHFEESEIKEGALNSVVEIDKRSTHIDLRLRITGVVKVSCDRCLDMFMHPVDCENRLLVKLGKRWEENDPELLTIPSDEHELDIKQYLYEFINLALPIQRVHPAGKDGRSTCNPEMVSKIGKHRVKSDNDSDPRWNELKKLKNN
jgi:uncharacterized metal-binding protein YceD (DUF177 family)